jgi:hypothetical protein
MTAAAASFLAQSCEDTNATSDEPYHTRVAIIGIQKLGYIWT